MADMFRKEALDKASSPERLDTLMQVTSPKGWVALLITGALLVGVGGWAIWWGSVPDVVGGRGILVRGSFREIVAVGDGSLVRLSVNVNDVVDMDQVIGEIAPQQMGDRVDNAFQRYQEGRRECELANGDSLATVAGHEATIVDNRGQIGTTEAQLVGARAEFDRISDLVERNLLPVSRVPPAQSQVNQLASQIATLEAQIRSVEAAILGERARVRRVCQESDELYRQWQTTASTEEEMTIVRSLVAGRVTQLVKSVGDSVRTGEAVAIVESEGEMEPVVYVEARNGARVRDGMEARIFSDQISREEYGYILATVQSVSETPVSLNAIEQVTRDQVLAQSLYGGSPKFEVRMELTPEPSTASGFAWSTSGGPPHGIDSGNLADADVVIERVKPIVYVMPFLRGRFGFQ